MKPPHLDVDSFVEALRGDLPSRRDEERVRARLLAAGVLVTGAAATTSNAAALGGSGLGMGGGAASPLAATASPFAAGAGAGTLATAPSVGAVASGAVTSGASAGAAGGLGAVGAPAALAKVGLLSKVLLLPVAAKLGVATTLAVAVASSVPLVLSPGDSGSSRHAASPAPQARAAEATSNEPRTASALRASGPGGERRESIASAQPSPASTTPSESQRGASSAASASTASAAVSSDRVRRANAATPERGRTQRVRASTLGEETRLMEQAMLALAEGDEDLAQRLLQEHARRFPRGLLVPERERARERLRLLDADRH